MPLKQLLLFAVLLTYFTGFSQLPDNFGQLTPFEQRIDHYAKDSTANSVVLYERGYNYFTIVNRRTVLKKKYHVKIKILNEKAYELGNVSIPLYFNEDSEEQVTEIKAITHNYGNPIEVQTNAFYTNDISDNWREKTFTFPNLKPGSILEYAYTIESPFHYNFAGWQFQREIPVLHSEFNAMIPGNWKYNQALYGSLDLTINERSVKKDCFLSADCEVLKYVMNDIPAFKKDEKYMLASSNYISRIEFELAEYRSLIDGHKNRFAKTWKDVDREFRKDKDIGKQLSTSGFPQKMLPPNLLEKGDNLTKATNIFNFVKSHFNWNETYGFFSKSRVKEAFDKRTGSASEINMALINLLNAAGLKSHLVLVSTRQHGLPKKIYPVMSDFNYCIAKVEIEGKSYLLDATDKYMPFGMLPFRTLNSYGRVMDFKNESYWYDILPEKKNRHQVRAQLKFDLAQKKALGILDVVNFGYNAIDKRRMIDRYDENEYIDIIEGNIHADLAITSYQSRKDFNTDTKTSERFEFELENLDNGEIIYFNPFLVRFFEQNPFLLDERHYPVDFGYPRMYKYSINITIPEGYTVQELPKVQALQLGDQKVIFKFNHKAGTNQIAFTFDLTLNSSQIKAENYDGLKDVFKHVIDVQKNSLVVFKKK